jgi:hypothetical protein
MLARGPTTIVPTNTLAEAIDTTRIHRVAGLTSGHMAVITTPPFRRPPTRPFQDRPRRRPQASHRALRGSEGRDGIAGRL